MVTKETESLTQMLLESRVSQLPEENDPAKIWVLALVKVLRKTGQKDYVIAEHDFFGWNEIRVKSEMAGVGIPAEVESIHPYSYLTALDMPTVKTKEDIINFLASRTKEDAEYLSSLGNDVLKKMLYNVCIKNKASKWGQKQDYEDYVLGIKEPEHKVSNVIDFSEEDKKEEPVKSSEPENAEEEKVEDENPVLGEEPKKRGRKPKE